MNCKALSCSLGYSLAHMKARCRWIKLMQPWIKWHSLDLTKEAQASSTRERAPELFEDFVKSHGDSEIGVSAEAVRKLYGDKVPTPDDNILGSVPDLAKQLEAAEQFGGDVQIPLSTWLAKVDPEVAKALKDDVRVRKGGMTLNETKAPEGEKPEERPTPIDSVDAIRRPAGLDPMAAAEQMRLAKIENPDFAIGQKLNSSCVSYLSHRKCNLGYCNPRHTVTQESQAMHTIGSPGRLPTYGLPTCSSGRPT